MKKITLLTAVLIFTWVVGAYAFDGGEIHYTKPVKYVPFSHKYHVQEKKISCDKCHSGLFELKALSAQEKPDFNMQAMYKGKYCGACHNGKDAFAANTQCARCHLGVKGYARLAKMQKADTKSASQVSYTADVTVGKGDTAVKFRHTTHSSVAKCTDCHNRLFNMKAGSSKITYADHSEGRACFSCHNGSKAFHYETCTNCHTKTPSPKGDIHYKVKGYSPARFPHDLHSKMFKCEDCHPKHYKMKAGATKMTMDAMYKGKYCGVCHNGNVAFASTDCMKCHK